MPKELAVEVTTTPETSRTGRALAVLGDQWTLLILLVAFRGSHRYQDIRDAIGASDSVLAGRLKAMTEAGLLTMVPYKEGRIRYEYHLTPAGKATWRIFVAAWGWEREWLSGIPGMHYDLLHRTCGNLTDPTLVCGKCELPVTTRDTTITRVSSQLHYIGQAPRYHRQRREYRRQRTFGMYPETLELLGDRWSMALLSAAVIGLRRFSEFEHFLGIPPTVLSAQLARFVELGVFRVEQLAGRNGRSVYRFTDKGRGLADVLMQFVRWAEENVTSGELSSIEIRHDACDRTLVPDYMCDHCGKILKRREVEFVPSERQGDPE
ncbi:winged helix-turn-helix transcriptional regulator [Homoserinimonas sp. A520]